VDRQDQVGVDQKLFPKFDVKAFMKQETIQFLSHVIGENLSLHNLIKSKFMLINNAMAKHHGMPSVYATK